MATRNATVIATHDAGQPETLRDEFDIVWKNVIDNTDGTFAVESDDGEAGIAVWRMDGSVDINVAKDGAFYGVNCTEEFVARRGEWVENDSDE